MALQIHLFLFAFFLLPRLFPVLSSDGQGGSGSIDEPKCSSQSFYCGRLGDFGFPFYEITTTTGRRCGLCRLNCTAERHPTIQLGTSGLTYEVLPKTPSSNRSRTKTPSVFDKVFQDVRERRSCKDIPGLNISNTSSVTFTILYITVFQCSRNGGDRDDGDYDLYYNYNLPLLVSSYYDPPSQRNCQALRLPHPTHYGLFNPWTTTDWFSLITGEFSIQLQLTPDCAKCHAREGLCLDTNGSFTCPYRKKNHHIRLIIVPAFGVGALSLILLIVICFRRRFIVFAKLMFFGKNKTQRNLNVENFLKNHRFLTPQKYSYREIKKMTDSFKVKLGGGGYGCVYKGKLQNGDFVAVKIFNESKGNGEDFINEVASVGNTSHVNVVSLLGFCFEGDKKAVIYEFMPNGSLEKFICDHGTKNADNTWLGWEKLYQIAIGIARGLEYLHRGCNTRILHFDIKPHNILLDQDFCPKISDFGLAKLSPKKESIVSMSGMRGTPGYIAPEVFSRIFGEVSHKSDVYSYGMMVLEIVGVGARKNIEVGVEDSNELYFPQWIYKRVELDEDLGLQGISNDEENKMARKMVIVGLWCIQPDPSNRPSMKSALEMLEGNSEALKIPPKPFFHTPSHSLQSLIIDISTN